MFEIRKIPLAFAAFLLITWTGIPFVAPVPAVLAKKPGGGGGGDACLPENIRICKDDCAADDNACVHNCAGKKKKKCEDKCLDTLNKCEEKCGKNCPVEDNEDNFMAGCERAWLEYEDSLDAADVQDYCQCQWKEMNASNLTSEQLKAVSDVFKNNQDHTDTYLESVTIESFKPCRSLITDDTLKKLQP